MVDPETKTEQPDFRKQYLGDGVYASFDGYQIWLVTDGGSIAIDPEVYMALREYGAKIWELNP